MENIFKNYTKMYPVSKTLKFSLKPMYETLENIEKYGILSGDENRRQRYVQVKKIFDKCHKEFIETALSDISISGLDQLFRALNNDRLNGTEEFTSLSLKLTGELSKKIKNHPMYKCLEPNAIISSLTGKKSSFFSFTDEEIKVLSNFERFATYFQGYKETRENVYSKETGSVCYRLIFENFPKFANNIRLFNSLEPDIQDEAETFTAGLRNGISLKEVFTPEFYNNLLTQKGIEFYNLLIGGLSAGERTKDQGLNEFLNEKYQNKLMPKKVIFTQLFKQILSDREKISFIPDALVTDKEVIDILKGFSCSLSRIVSRAENDACEAFASSLTDKAKIYVDKKQLSFLSQLMCEGQWSTLKNLLYDNGVKDDSKLYTVAQINELTGKNCLEIVWNKYKESEAELRILSEKLDEVLNKETISSYEQIKDYLDCVQTCEKTLKIFAVSDTVDKDILFYPAFDLLYGAYRSNVSVYNMVRNYATKKPYSTRKYKLNFDNPTLAEGWSQSKEYSYNTMIFTRDGNYYLGILNAKSKPKVAESVAYSDGSYKKMVYNLLPGPNKMLPKVFFSEKGIKKYGNNSYIMENYNDGKHKKGEEFDIKFCRDLIDYFKECIAKNEEWAVYNFQFSDTDTYNDISEFYSEISAQGYKISFSYVDEKQMHDLVKEGKLFLFQIYNKDFSRYAKGTPNLHTLYWKELFSPENLAHPLFRLSGGAELFYRPASVENPFVHKKGSVLVSRNDVHKQPVDQAVYEEVIKCISEGADISYLQEKYPDLIFKTAEYDIVKDKRYASPSFAFHVPIVINDAVKDRSTKINTQVLNDISWNSDVNIIGVDRGERNLLYVSVINQNGEILHQKSYNVIENKNSSVDYQKKLDRIEKDRDYARKNWKRIGNIKDVKEGYLSAVVKEIADMMVKYNAIVVMEDLNVGFKRGRFRIEKQVYQKFEKMLIDKLNYFADKNLPVSDPGGVRLGYQLTPKFKPFREMGKQVGFVFYVPASYTSKIDPRTGFVNLFTSKQLSYRSREQAREFISAFDGIYYDKKYSCFRFDFRYSNFGLMKTDYTDAWQVYTCGDGRIVHTRKNGYDTTRKIDVTTMMKQLLDMAGINYSDDDNLVDKIIHVEDASFYKELLWLFRVTVQLRYEDTANDFILSPICKDGCFFDSRAAADNMPQDGDANGAYHIALQGLRIIKKRISNGKITPDKKGMQTYNWLSFVQKKEYARK